MTHPTLCPFFRSELAENEIIPSDIAKDVKDILSNDSDLSDTDQGRDEYDYYKIGLLLSTSS